MKITNLHQFLHSYFTANQCDVIEDHQGRLIIQLTEEIDKQLMNRPFYWHYIKSIGNTGEPMVLTLITDPKVKDAEGQWIHFGSPLLHKIFENVTTNGKFIQLFQELKTDQNIALFPWLLINIKIIYQGRQKREEMFAIGLNLVNGMMKVNMMEELNNYKLSKSISDLCYPLTPIIKMKSGYNRIIKVLDDYIAQQKYDWAEESMKMLNEELEMIDHFFDQNTEEEIKKKQEEISQVTKRYTPKIIYKVINGGMIYLTEQFHN